MLFQVIAEVWIYVQQILLFKPITLEFWAGQIFPIGDIYRWIISSLGAALLFYKYDRLVKKSDLKLSRYCPNVLLNIKGVHKYDCQ